MKTLEERTVELKQEIEIFYQDNPNNLSCGIGKMAKEKLDESLEIIKELEAENEKLKEVKIYHLVSAGEYRLKDGNLEMIQSNGSCCHCEDLLKENEKLKGNGWKTIETLYKTPNQRGKTILVWTEESGALQVWRADTNDYFYSNGEIINPTHWMPLPEAPKLNN